MSKGGIEENPEEEELTDDEEVEVEGVDEVDINQPTLLSVPLIGKRGDVSSTNGSAPEQQESDESDEDCAWEPRSAVRTQ